MQTTFKSIFKEEVSPPFPTGPCARFWTHSLTPISMLPEGWRQTRPLPTPSQFSPQGARSAAAGVQECSLEEEGWARGALIPLPASFSLPKANSRVPKANSALGPDHRAVSCWAVTSQFAVIKRKGGWGRGQVVKYYLFAQATRAEAISCPSHQGQRADVFSRHSCS